MVIELEIKRIHEKIDKQFAELRMLLLGKGILSNWISQEVACAMLGIKKRRLIDIRVHQDKDGKKVGHIAWRKGTGRSVQYSKKDIEAYLNQITVS